MQSSAPAFRFRRASASFQALDADELSFEAGDIVEILWEWQELAVDGWLWGRLAFGEAGWRFGRCDHPFGLVPAFLFPAQHASEPPISSPHAAAPPGLRSPALHNPRAKPLPASPGTSPISAANAAYLVWVGWKRYRGRRVEVLPWDCATQEILDRVALLRAEKKWVALMRAEKARVRAAARRSLEEESEEDDVLEEEEEDEDHELDYKVILELIQASSLSCSLRRTSEEAAAARASRARQRQTDRLTDRRAVTTSKRPPPLPPLTPPLPSPSPSVEVLKECVCPITAEIMTDPVCTSDGFTYERTAITKWLRTKDTSPSTGAMLESKTLIPNFLARSIIRRL